jgi:hypothetical protein
VDAGGPSGAPRRPVGTGAGHVRGGTRVVKAPRTLRIEDAAFGLLACLLLLGAPVAVRLLGLH